MDTGSDYVEIDMSEYRGFPFEIHECNNGWVVHPARSYLHMDGLAFHGTNVFVFNDATALAAHILKMATEKKS